MRVLVEQTSSETAFVLGRLGVLWNEGGTHTGKVGLHVVMGGTGSGDWHLWPEQDAVIVGTQDMLLSRALNRGYGAGRARWPVEFGLLNRDALWILDEVQLMDVGLATTAQLQAFRRADDARPPGLFPSTHSWWMSATLQPAWLQNVDTREMLDALPPPVEIPEGRQNGGLWDVTKSVELVRISSDNDLANETATLAVQKHRAATVTLIVVNRVELARAIYAELERMSLEAEVRLVHSRFRSHERASWRGAFLSKSAVIPSGGRIIVATQVVEAGVDISAQTLITDLAPWPSLVQRLGRCARYTGEHGSVVVLDRGWLEGADEQRALPYDVPALLTSKTAIGSMSDVSPRALEAFERSLSPERRHKLYPYEPRHLLLRREWNDLFDTTPDLTGADIDISRFVRSGDDLDVQVFWRRITNGDDPPNDWKPGREELCAVPFRKAQDWLCGKETKESRASKLQSGIRAWVWDWLEGVWKHDTRRSDLTPGRVVLVDSRSGGYSARAGWDPDFAEAEPVHTDAAMTAQDRADDSQDSEDLSTSDWKTIATHGKEAAAIARSIATELGLSVPITELAALAAEVHDLGKSIPFFQGSIRRHDRPKRVDLAKAPSDAWPRSCLYRAENDQRRPGLRHELASALALFDVLRRFNPGCSALLGDCAALLELDVTGFEQRDPEGIWERRIMDLSEAGSFDLLVYLVAAHHGKVRMSLHAAPIDQDYRPKPEDDRGLPIRGIREGDELPPLHGEGNRLLMDRSHLTLEPACMGLSNATGRSWTDRALGLMDRYGPGALALLEAVVRAADVRATCLTTLDPLLASEAAE
jgi:CRISPR-associated endonuclease/helicase Cas3